MFYYMLLFFSTSVTSAQLSLELLWWARLLSIFSIKSYSMLNINYVWQHSKQLHRDLGSQRKLWLNKKGACLNFVDYANQICREETHLITLDMFTEFIWMFHDKISAWYGTSRRNCQHVGPEYINWWNGYEKRQKTLSHLYVSIIGKNPRTTDSIAKHNQWWNG